MNFSNWAIKNPIPVILLFIIATVMGAYSFDKLGIASFPDMDFPSVTVTVSVPGENASQLETQVTRKVEDSVANVSDIKHITSTVTDGSSVTTIEFDLGKNLQDAVDEVKDEVSKVKDQFPSGANEPQVSKVTIGTGAILTYKIDSSSMDEMDLSWYVDNNMSKLLSSVAGVGKITRQGGIDRQVEVLLDPVKMLGLNTTINNISSQLYSVRQDYSGGKITYGSKEQSIEIKQPINSVDDLSNLVIPIANSSYVKLRDVATITDTAADIRQKAFFNGESIVSFQVFPTKGSSELMVANLVRAKIATFNQNTPTIKVTEISNSVSSIKATYDGSMQAIYEGAILAILVVWLFLRDWRATLISASALPLSLIPTFIFIYYMGFTLNTITLLALTLVIGILVDDAIVEVENIVRHLRMGKKPIQAAMDAATEIGTAVIATSITLVAVFLPTAFMGGVPGRIFKQFGWTAAIAVLASLVVARLVTPMMAAYFLKADHGVETEPKLIMRKYIHYVSWCLDNPKKTVLSVLAFFVCSISLIMFIPSTFFPSQDNAQISVQIETPQGSTMDQITKAMNQGYNLTKDIKDITSIYSTIGSGIQSGSTINSDSSVTSGTMTYTLSDNNKRKMTQAQLETLISSRLEQIPGVKISNAGSGMGEKYSLVLASDNADLLKKVSKKLEQEIQQNKELGTVNSSLEQSRPEIIISPDLSKAAMLGITSTSIGQAVRVATSGDFDTSLAKMDLPERQVSIVVKLDKKYIRSPTDIGLIPLSSNNGIVPLNNVASITTSNSPAQVTRYDRSGSVTFDIDLQGKTVSEIDKKVQALPVMKNLPSEVHQIASGDTERMQEMVSSFILAMISGILCVYCILVLLFKNFKQPITILIALPLAIAGALVCMMVLGYSISMSTLIGILMLMGIVTKNSILLVDYALIGINEHKVSRKEAILNACKKRSQPIIMTTCAMVLGMLPIAFGLEGDSSFRSPMAITVISGLLTSTVLSLFVIPVVFELVDDFSLSKLIGKFRFNRRK